jgi:Transcriptional regulator/sugar kinase
MEEKILGIDLGGTYCRIGMVGNDNRVYHPHIISSECITRNGNIIKDLCEVIKNYIRKNQIIPLALAIGVPGSVTADHQTVYCAPNLKDAQGRRLLDNVNLGERLQEEIGIPVYVNKDTNYLLYYDREYFQLFDKNIIVSCYIGTGLGGSVMLNNEILQGKNGMAMDIGHISFYHSRSVCNCGKYGCAETHASGRVLRCLWKKNFSDEDFENIFVKYSNTKIIKEFIYSCALIVSVLGTIFTPEAYVLGGGVVEMKGFPRQEFEHCLRELLGRAATAGDYRIYYSEKSKIKGVVGAAIFARGKIKNDCSSVSLVKPNDI